MKQTQEIMGMPITIEILDSSDPEIFDRVFDYFRAVDEKFSTYKPTSEISRINQRELKIGDSSSEMQEVFRLSEETKQETKGYFDIKKPDGQIDPSGLVKGWAIFNAAKLVESLGIKEYFVEAGGDIQVSGKVWKVGIKNPFNLSEIVKVLFLDSQGIATSGTYERGAHIYNPHQSSQNINEVVSLTVVGPNIYEADRFATAAFAMGRPGIQFIESRPGLEGYMIDKNGIGTETSGFEQVTKEK